MRLSIPACGLALLTVVTTAIAADARETGFLPAGDILMVQAAPGVIHFNSDPEHANHSWLLGVEWQRPSHWLAGYSYFNNSFNQKSHYLYGGYWWPIWERHPGWDFKLTGGVMYVYKEPYEDKVPFNHDGFSPGLIPAVGYKTGRFNVQLNLLGGAGLMLTFGYDLLR